MIDLSGYLQGIVKKDTSNALSPLLWLNGLVSFPCLVGSYFSDGGFRYCLFVAALLIISYTLLKYEALSKRDPRLLMSERTQIELAKLDIIQEKGGEIKFDVIDIPLGEEPKRLGAGKEGERNE